MSCSFMNELYNLFSSCFFSFCLTSVNHYSMCKQSNSCDPMMLTCCILWGGFDLLFIPTSSCRAARIPLSEYLAVFSVQREASERAWERQHASREDTIDAHFFYLSVDGKCLFTTIPRTTSVLLQAW